MSCRLHRTLLTAFAFVFVPAAGWGQASYSPPPPAFSTDPSASIAELPFTETLTPPPPVKSVQMPLMFASEVSRNNYLMASLRLGSGYDDNILGTPSGHVSDTSYLILPSINLAQSRGHLSWTLGYSPGFTISPHLTQRDQAVHDLHLLFAYRLSSHVTAEFHENFEKTNSLFSGLLSNTPSTGSAPLQQANTSIITPLADRTGNGTGLDLAYQFSRCALVGLSGSFNFVNYDALAGGFNTNYNLFDSRSWGGNAFYAHRFSNQHWAGVTYNVQRLSFIPSGRTNITRALLFYSFSGESHVAFSIWAGPERATVLAHNLSTPIAGTPDSEKSWGVSGGANLSWQGERTRFGVGYIRQTSDGGGLARAVNLQQFNGEIGERLSLAWTATADLGYAKNDPLKVAASATAPYRSWVGNVGLSYGLTENVSVGLRYGRDQLRYEYATLPVLSFRNRAWFSIVYSFSRPIGR
jgi:hypothetical protein